MKRSTEDLLQELYTIDKNNNYSFRFHGGTTWEVKNKRTQEGLYTDNGFNDVKRWLLKDMSN